MRVVLYFLQKTPQKKTQSCDFSKAIATHAWQWAKRNVGFRSCKGYSRYSLLIIEWRQAGNVQDVARCPDTLICRLHFGCVGCCELMRLMGHCEEMLVVTHYIDRVRSSIRKPPTSRLITFSIPLQNINPMVSTYGIYPTVSKIIHVAGNLGVIYNAMNGHWNASAGWPCQGSLGLRQKGQNHSDLGLLVGEQIIFQWTFPARTILVVSELFWLICVQDGSFRWPQNWFQDCYAPKKLGCEC